MTIQPFQPAAKNSRYAIPAAPNRVRQRAMIRLIMRRIRAIMRTASLFGQTLAQIRDTGPRRGPGRGELC
jgi:hypothetical protein